MAKTSKKALGATMAGVMAIGAVAGAVSAVDQVKVAKAAESQAVKSAKAKIAHLTKSLKTNYLGTKNQAQWEIYIKEAKALIANIPTTEASVASALTTEVNKDQELVKALAGINKVEKSYEVNFKGIKNAKQWREYLTSATESLKAVDQKVFGNQYAELVKRLNASSGDVKKIEDAFKVELDAATKLFETAKETMLIEDANKALAAAEKLGTCEESDKLENTVKGLKTVIEKGEVDVKTVGIAAKTYDDDTKDQKLSLLINGEAMNADFLRGAGYDIDFVQTDEPNNGDKLFDGQDIKSKDGKLAKVLATGDYEVQVTVSKKGNVFVSDKTKVVVQNLDNNASSISAFELTNYGKNITPDVDTDTDRVVQKSSTLVVNEKAKITSIDSSNAKNIKGGFEVKSSNDAVISIAKENGVSDVISANAPGTAKLTITYGKVTKEVTITVKGDAREATKVTPKSTSVATAKNGSVDIIVNVYDQYGDPMVSIVGETPGNDNDRNVYVEALNGTASDKVIKTIPASKTADKDGEAVLSVNAGTDDGTDTLIFKNESKDVLARVNFKTVKDASVDRSKIEVVNKDNYSKDTNLDKGDSDEKNVRLEVKNYNKDGVCVGSENLENYTVKFDSKIVKVFNAGDDSNDDKGAPISNNGKISATVKMIDIEADDKGISDIAIYDDKGVLVAKTSVKVEDTANKLNTVKWNNSSSISYSNEEINYEDALSIVKDDKNSGYDPIVSGIQPTASTNDKIRISDDNAKAVIYIDNGSRVGEFDSTDDVLGILEAKIVSGGNGQLETATQNINPVKGNVLKTAKGDKGTIIFTISDTKGTGTNLDPDKVISSTSIYVDVKGDSAAESMASKINSSLSLVVATEDKAGVEAAVKAAIGAKTVQLKDETINTTDKKVTGSYVVTDSNNVTSTTGKVTITYKTQAEVDAAADQKAVNDEAAKITNTVIFEVATADKADAAKVTAAAVIAAQAKVTSGYTVTAKAEGTVATDKLTITFTVTKGTKHADTAQLVLTFTNK